MKKYYTLSLLFLISMASFGQILVSEDFTYSDGNLIGNGDWVAHDAAGSNAVQVSSNQIVIIHGSGSREDVNIPFTPVTAGAVYASFDFMVSNLGSAIAGTDYEYFAHFGEYKARVDIISPSDGGDFSVGISSGASTAEAEWSTDLSYDTSYRLTVKYDISNGQAQLWVNALSETDPSILGTTGTGVSVSNFSFRQSNSTSDETVVVDNLIVGQTFDNTLSAQENVMDSKFLVYPNPTKKATHLSFLGLNNSEAFVTIYNVIGERIIISKLPTNNTLDIASLTSGIYMVVIEQGYNTVVKKIIVN